MHDTLPGREPAEEGDVDAPTMDHPTLAFAAPSGPDEGRDDLDDGPPSTGGPRLEPGRILGEGGMGVVRAAVQRRMRRIVAVKELRPDATGADAHRMLREAWVTGGLEHPNIVPIHDIERDGAGSPLVVMRRIEGATWEDRLGDASWATAAGARDLLEQNLRVFIQVCYAVEYAHVRGVLHRDIKPANVMLGRFGEVYLLDWGIALALREGSDIELPLAGPADGMAGTLAYMAPEMAMLIDAPLSERTDVYLLGATLFHAVVGRPPHAEETMADALASIGASPPSLPAEVPVGLASVLIRALQRGPEGRHPSVGHLRIAVQAFLAHRDSMRVTTAGEQLQRRLAQALRRGAPSSEVHELFHECRFAFREALRTWPENSEAQRALTSVVVLVAEHELTREPHVAAAVLESLPSPPPDMVEKVRRAVRRHDARVEANARVVAGLDPQRGRRVRTALLVVGGLSGTLSPILGQYVGEISNRRYAVSALVLIPILLVVWCFSKDLRATVFNRRIVAVIALVLLCRSALYAASERVGIPVASARALDLGLLFVMGSMLAITVETRLWPMTVALLAASLCTVMWPTSTAWATSLGYAAVTLTLALVWRSALVAPDLRSTLRPTHKPNG